MNTKNRLIPTKNKKNLKELPILNQGKTSSLQEHTAKIEQKLNLLKEKIQIKKKTKQIVQKKQQPNEIDSELSLFLQNVGMSTYKQKLISNHIDSFQILSEATQKELEQLGIPKGHCIKILINIEKYKSSKTLAIKSEKNQKLSKQSRQLKTKQSDRVVNNEQSLMKQVQSICIGQQSLPLQIKKTCFCLFCYKKSQRSFCSQNCQEHYNAMFRKYEDNLIKAQQNFKKQKVIQQKQQADDEDEDCQEIINNFDFLEEQCLDIQDFDYEAYEQIKKQLE